MDDRRPLGLPYSTQLRGYWLDIYKMYKEISAYLISKARFLEIRGIDVSVYFIIWGKRKGDGRGLKLRYDSNANNNKEEQQEEAISYTNTPSFAA